MLIKFHKSPSQLVGNRREYLKRTERSDPCSSHNQSKNNQEKYIFLKTLNSRSENFLNPFPGMENGKFECDNSGNKQWNENEA